MVPTEEERLPVRISISVGGLSRTLRRSPLHFVMSHSFSSHLHRDGHGHASCKANEHSLFSPRQFCSLNFLITFDIFLCTFLARYWPAVSVVRHGYTIINNINLHSVVEGVGTGCSVR
jgi:hypothetical protein